MDNGNWAKTLLFTLIGFGLGWAICCLTCGRCAGGSCESGSGRCHSEQSCQGECKGACSGACQGKCDGGSKGECCKGGHTSGHGDENVKVIVTDLEKAGFQGDTTIAIEGGTVQVSRSGDSTTVRVEVREEEHEHAH